MTITAGGAGYTGLWTNVYIQRKFVEMLAEELIFAKFSEPATIPANSGGYVCRWNIPVRFLGTMTAKTEGTLAAAITSTRINSVEATISQYYEHMAIGIISKKSMIDGSMDVYYEQFAFAGASVIDRGLLNAGLTGATFQYISSSNTAPAAVGATGATTTTGNVVAIKDFPRVAGYFFGNNCRGFQSLHGDFLWAMSPVMEVNLATEFSSTALSWSDVHQYTDTGYSELFDKLHMIGRFGAVTALRTNMLSTGTFGTTCAMYKSIALARYGLGWSGLGEGAPTKAEFYHKQTGPTDTSQPVPVYDTVGYNLLAAFAALDGGRILAIYSTF